MLLDDYLVDYAVVLSVLPIDNFLVRNHHHYPASDQDYVAPMVVAPYHLGTHQRTAANECKLEFLPHHIDEI
jgi:hypothetical protein